MKFNGEQVVWTDMKGDNGEPQVLIDHLERYLYAMSFVHNKKVLDAAAGSCYGSFLLSMLAKEVISADISQEALDEGKSLPYASPHSYLVADFNKDVLPEADVCVSMETIEHLASPFFLDNLKTKELIFSLPLNPITPDGTVTNVNPYHTMLFFTPEQALSYITNAGWKVVDHALQAGKYVVGRAIRA